MIKVRVMDKDDKMKYHHEFKMLVTILGALGGVALTALFIWREVAMTCFIETGSRYC